MANVPKSYLQEVIDDISEHEEPVIPENQPKEDAVEEISDLDQTKQLIESPKA